MGFTAAELAEMARADAEIEATFRLTNEDLALGRQIDLEAVLEGMDARARKQAERQRRYYEANRDKVAEYMRRYYEANRDMIDRIAANGWKTPRGIDPSTYQGE
jgi:hypothetical protein